jgi:lipid-A-disaccharide synthase
MLETLVETAEQIRRCRPDVHFLVPVAPGLALEDISKAFSGLRDVWPIETAVTDIYEIARACQAIVTVSGTVTLQVALAGTPMAIFYKLSPLTYAVGRRLVRVDHIGLANIVAGKRIVREFVQDEATPENLSSEVLKLIGDIKYARKIRNELALVREKLGEPGCSARVARMLLDMVKIGVRES